MTKSELKTVLSMQNNGVRQDHVRSGIMVIPGPYHREVMKVDVDFPVGSERYKEYLKPGFSGLTRLPLTTAKRRHTLKPELK